MVGSHSLTWGHQSMLRAGELPPRQGSREEAERRWTGWPRSGTTANIIQGAGSSWKPSYQKVPVVYHYGVADHLSVLPCESQSEGGLGRAGSRASALTGNDLFLSFVNLDSLRM